MKPNSAKRTAQNPRTGARDAVAITAARRGNRARNRGRSRIEAVSGWAREAQFARVGPRSISSAHPASAPEPIGRHPPVAAAASRRTVSRKNASACARRNAKTRLAARAACASCRAWHAKLLSRLADKPAINCATAGARFVPASFTNMRKSWPPIHCGCGPCAICSRAAEVFDERGFNEMVHVLSGRRVKPCRIARRAPGNLVERGEGVAHFLDGENARPISARPPTHDRQPARKATGGDRMRKTLKLVEQFVGRASNRPPTTRLPDGQVSRGLLLARGHRAFAPFACSGIVTAGRTD